MPLNLKLSDVRHDWPDKHLDPMQRDWLGWDPAKDHEQNFKRNRGIWFLGRRVYKEEFATFSHDGRVVMVVKLDLSDPITEIASLDGKSIKFAINGLLLAKGDPDFDRLYDSPVDGFRNPVTYPSAGAKTCACGCGEEVAGTRTFLPGHDQRAIHERITKQWGTTLGFIDWFDEEFGAPGDEAPEPLGDADPGIVINQQATTVERIIGRQFE